MEGWSLEKRCIFSYLNDYCIVKNINRCQLSIVCGLLCWLHHARHEFFFLSYQSRCFSFMCQHSSNYIKTLLAITSLSELRHLDVFSVKMFILFDCQDSEAFIYLFWNSKQMMMLLPLLLKLYISNWLKTSHPYQLDDSTQLCLQYNWCPLLTVDE